MTGKARARLFGWERFPFFLILATGFVFAVNARFVMLAMSTFPGVAALHDFDSSNDYNRVLAAVDAQNALGWRVRAAMDGAVPSVDARDGAGAALGGLAIRADAVRPLGEAARVAVAFREIAPGHYEADGLPGAGQWDLLVRLSRDGREMRVTRRVVAR